MAITTKNLLLLDGIGALITATLLSQVVARYEPLFGMPKSIVYLLSVVALGFAVFSLSSHLLVKHRLSRYLGVIIWANISYCLATAALLFVYREQLSGLGITYFVAEIIVILLLVYLEYQKGIADIRGTS
ncbi:hypothetical protein [Cyclobacterium xiamenense]|jgi:hypothetical protein|uniref:hypothetical protein n=1 Tax=Cyclobacterium xiamenense TaxID=1297121 RepID=UPI0035D0511A